MLWNCLELQAGAAAAESIAQRFVGLLLSNRWQTVTQHHRQALEMVQPYMPASLRLFGIPGNQGPGVRQLRRRIPNTGEDEDFLLKCLL